MKTITDNTLNNLTHKISDTLGAYGVDLPTDIKYALSDCIAGFLEEKMRVSTVEEAPSLDSDEVHIIFNVAATRGKQTLKIFNEKYSQESIVEGINEGVLETTINHHADEGSFVRVARTGENIALITSQSFDLECMDVE